jgi:hypothetical protein
MRLTKTLHFLHQRKVKFDRLTTCRLVIGINVQRYHFILS